MFKLETLIRVKRCKVVEVNLVTGFFRVFEIDRVDLEQRKIPLAIPRRTDQALNSVTSA